MKTSTFTVNNVLDPEPVIVTSMCRSVTIGEDPGVAGWPNSDYRVKGTAADSALTTQPAGTRFTFERRTGQPAYSPGQIIGYVETVTGSTTFLQVEQ